MLENLKTMLDINGVDEDGKLELIIANTEARLKLLLGGADEVPEALEYIVQEVSIIRFNRIGSEGLTAHTVEGESLTFADSDFDGYMRDVQAWLDAQKDVKKGKVQFI